MQTVPVTAVQPEQGNGEMPRQLIRYGAPGTGKSFGLDGETGDAVVFRTTFHPDSDYSTFVGAYKPTMKGGGESERISYSFRPQAFMNAYVSAWSNLDKNVVLVIEEINRGNCAQIFGDLFQLLDRDEDGYSMYPIDADADLAKWLAADERFGRLNAGGAAGDADGGSRGARALPGDVASGKKLMLPPNLYIWATMNTSDQSLFPIDSAFKRRWDWQYVPIAKPEKADDPNWKDRKIVANGVKYDWWTFISIINAHIADVTKSEDKQLGYFFVKAPDATGVITAERFANKVLFYLFNDVFKDWDLPAKIFGNPSGSKYVFKDFFYDATTTVGGKTFKPGDVKEEVVAEFIERQEHDGEKVVKE